MSSSYLKSPGAELQPNVQISVCSQVLASRRFCEPFQGDDQDLSYFLYNMCRFQRIYQKKHKTVSKFDSNLLKKSVAVIPVDLQFKLGYSSNFNCDVYALLEYTSNIVDKISSEESKQASREVWVLQKLIHHEEACDIISMAQQQPEYKNVRKLCIPISARGFFKRDKQQWMNDHPITTIPDRLFRETKWSSVFQKTPAQRRVIPDTMHVDVSEFLGFMDSETKEWICCYSFKDQDFEWLRLFKFHGYLVGICITLNVDGYWYVRWISSGKPMINRLQVTGASNATLRDAKRRAIRYHINFRHEIIHKFDGKAWNKWVDTITVKERHTGFKDEVEFPKRQRQLLIAGVCPEIYSMVLRKYGAAFNFDKSRIYLWLYQTFVLQIELQETMLVSSGTTKDTQNDILIFNAELDKSVDQYYAVCRKYPQHNGTISWYIKGVYTYHDVRILLQDDEIKLPSPSRTQNRFIKKLRLPEHFIFNKLDEIDMNDFQMATRNGLYNSSNVPLHPDTIISKPSEVHVTISREVLGKMIADQISQWKIEAATLPVLHTNCKNKSTILFVFPIYIPKFATYTGIMLRPTKGSGGFKKLRPCGIYLQSSLVVEDYRATGYMDEEKLKMFPVFDIYSMVIE